MARTWAKDPSAHRDLIRLSENVQRGEDIRQLEAAAKDRLDARGVDTRTIGRDGVLTESEFDKIETAARLLGALESTLNKRDSKGRRVLTVGVQRMVRDPDSRTPEQLARARQRMDALVKERKERNHNQGGGVSGLTAAHRSSARRVSVASFHWSYLHAPAIGYSQDADRWDWYHDRLRYANGKYPRDTDCSGMATWALWNGLTHAGGLAFPDIVNGQSWLGGYTGTLSLHGEHVEHRMPGDLVIYGNAWPYEHTAMIATDTSKVYSHGSEAGPFYLDWNYRDDVAMVVRFI